MPWVTDEQITRAKQVGILEYLMAREPHNLIREGSDRYILRDHDSFVISNSKWCWFSRGFGSSTGSALSYLTKVRGYSFPDAVLELSGGNAVSYARRAAKAHQPAKTHYLASSPTETMPTSTCTSKSAFSSTFTLSPHNRNNTRVTAYLLSRGIDRDIIERCFIEGILYESKQYHNCVFIGKDMNNQARFACMRGTSSGFRQDAEGSDKRFGFCLTAVSPPGSTVMVAEAPIDALSIATLRKMDSPDWDSCHYLSLSGTSPAALIQHVFDHPEIGHIVLCLDNDKAGRDGAERIMATMLGYDLFRDRILTFSVEPPPIGNDYNDTLLAIHKQRTQVNGHNPLRKEANISL